MQYIKLIKLDRTRFDRLRSLEWGRPSPPGYPLVIDGRHTATVFVECWALGNVFGELAGPDGGRPAGLI